MRKKKLNNFLEEINNKISTINSKFSEYKERNMKLISLYKLLINNYEQIKSIRNYNLNNNIILNDSFDLSNSDLFITDIHNPLDCISSKYNKLCAFYEKKNHIKTKHYSEYIITKKFCGFINVKKCIFLDEDKIMFIFFLKIIIKIYFIY
jgi:hypothetical protein